MTESQSSPLSVSDVINSILKPATAQQQQLHFPQCMGKSEHKGRHEGSELQPTKATPHHHWQWQPLPYRNQCNPDVFAGQCVHCQLRCVCKISKYALNDFVTARDLGLLETTTTSSPTAQHETAPHALSKSEQLALWYQSTHADTTIEHEAMTELNQLRQASQLPYVVRHYGSLLCPLSLFLPVCPHLKREADLLLPTVRLLFMQYTCFLDPTITTLSDLVKAATADDAFASGSSSDRDDRSPPTRNAPPLCFPPRARHQARQWLTDPDNLQILCWQVLFACHTLNTLDAHHNDLTYHNILLEQIMDSSDAMTNVCTLPVAVSLPGAPDASTLLAQGCQLVESQTQPQTHTTAALAMAEDHTAAADRPASTAPTAAGSGHAVSTTASSNNNTTRSSSSSFAHLLAGFQFDVPHRGFAARIFDFDFYYSARLRNSKVLSGRFVNDYGIGPRPHVAYDAHLFLNGLILALHTAKLMPDRRRRSHAGFYAFLDDALPVGCKGRDDVFVSDHRLRYSTRHHEHLLPTPLQLLLHPWFARFRRPASVAPSMSMSMPPPPPRPPTPRRPTATLNSGNNDVRSRTRSTLGMLSSARQRAPPPTLTTVSMPQAGRPTEQKQSDSKSTFVVFDATSNDSSSLKLLLWRTSSTFSCAQPTRDRSELCDTIVDSRPLKRQRVA